MTQRAGLIPPPHLHPTPLWAPSHMQAHSQMACAAGVSHKRHGGTTYHQEVIKQEDFSLVQSKFLGLIWVWNLEEPAVADQPPVRQRENLRGEGKRCPQQPAQHWGLGSTGLPHECVLPSCWALCSKPPFLTNHAEWTTFFGLWQFSCSAL